jgi:hypothetical protein
MKHRNSHFAIGYWSRLRRGRAVPDQADIDPRALKRLLPFVFLLDASRDGKFVYRLAGTTLCERFGMELRGLDFLAHWDADSGERLSVLLRQSLKTRTPLCVTSVGATDDCRMVEIETVLMPISFGSEEPERFIAVAQLLSDVGPILGRALTFERLVSASLVREGASENISDDASPPPPPPRLRPREEGTSHPRAPHLRLVVSQNIAAEISDPLTADAHRALSRLYSLLSTPLPRSRLTPVKIR